MKTAYKICINDLHLSMHLGWGDEERSKPQRACLHVEVEMLTFLEDVRETLEGTLNYQTLFDEIVRTCQAKPYKLLETLCKDVLDVIGTFQHVQRAKVTVEKPEVWNGLARPSITASRVWV